MACLLPVGLSESKRKGELRAPQTFGAWKDGFHRKPLCKGCAKMTTICTIKIEKAKPVPEVFLDLIRSRKNGCAHKSKKAYTRKQKHKKDYE